MYVPDTQRTSLGWPACQHHRRVQPPSAIVVVVVATGTREDYGGERSVGCLLLGATREEENDEDETEKAVEDEAQDKQGQHTLVRSDYGKHGAA